MCASKQDSISAPQSEEIPSVGGAVFDLELPSEGERAKRENLLRYYETVIEEMEKNSRAS